MNETFALRGLTFRNRVFVASGTFGYGDEVSDVASLDLLGGIVTKSLSLRPRDGNPPPRIAETSSGMLNSIGLANIGVERFVAEKLPKLDGRRCAVIANIAASSVEEYCTVLEMLDPLSRVDGFEINVSCPNVKEGGLSFGTDVSKVSLITKELRRRTRKPLIVKLTPNVTHIAEFARAAEGEGADAVSVINTLIGMAINIYTRRPKLSTVTGGLSGPAIKPIALAKVFETYKAVKIPVFGIGGISTWEDAIEFLLAGASAVQVGTANFVDPAGAMKLPQEIVRFCESRSVRDVGDLVGGMKGEPGVSVIQSWL
ncbi:MAG TPA: dihydroorotate dehydrogenase [Bacteroidota bacterium]|nr:dihydroorotate dehydrogenase [Bacteroidota bacterium]